MMTVTRLFDTPPSITAFAAIGGSSEGKGPLGNHFDYISDDEYFGKTTYEQAESELQKQTAELALEKAGLHFGDIDLAGINIFLTEFRPYLGERSSFLIPSDIENRLQIGSQERYDSQLCRFGNLKCDDKRIQAIIDLINKYHRCYDQEGYIECNI